MSGPAAYWIGLDRCEFKTHPLLIVSHYDVFFAQLFLLLFDCMVFKLTFVKFNV